MDGVHEGRNPRGRTECPGAFKVNRDLVSPLRATTVPLPS